MRKNNQDRLSKLTSKLRNLKINDRYGRVEKIRSLEQRIDILEENLITMKTENKETNEEINETLKLISQNIEDPDLEEFSYAPFLDKLNGINLQIDDFSEENRISDRRKRAIIEEKARKFRSSISKLARDRTDKFNELRSLLEDNLPKLGLNLDQEKAQRIDSDEGVLNKLENDVNEVKEEMDKEKLIRDENEQATFDMLKDIVEKIKNELEIETKEREEGEQMLMGLLEEAMNKLTDIQNAS